jgi:lysophospholipase L1-like esterase
MRALIKLITSLLTVTIGTFILFALLEVFARFMFPEFENHIHSEKKTLGINYFLSNDDTGRQPYPNHTSDLNRPSVVVLGDSISHGYGLAYEDIYWVRLQKILRLKQGANAPAFVSLSYAGNNLYDSIERLENFIQKHPDTSIKYILYQFNFNDLVPDAYSRKRLQTEKDSYGAPTTDQISNNQDAPTQVSEQAGNKALATTATDTKALSRSKEPWLSTLNRWRLSYFNHSVFLRVAQHYTGSLLKANSRSCEERALDALGPYTWTYGSKPFSEQSELLWVSFERAIERLKFIAEQRGIKLGILVSPLLFDIDTQGIHPHYNHLKYDFTCATINPSVRLDTISKRLGIELYDPTQFIKTSFDARIKEGNFTPFFFTADENHLTPTASVLMAEYLYALGFDQ